MIIRKGFLWGMISMLALASCQNLSDENIENGMDAEAGKWKMTMTVSEAETRASVDESQVVSGNRLPVRWDKSDKIKMMIGTDAHNVIPCEFVLKGESSIGSAIFEYVGDKVDPYYYYGIYPSLDFDQEGNVHLSVPVDGTIQQADLDDSRHLGAYRAMFSAPVERDECPSRLTGVMFRHLTSLVIFKITNLTEQEHYIKSIQLATSDGSPVFYSTAIFNPVTEKSVNVTGTAVSSTLLRFAKDGFILPAGEMHKAYLPVLPTGDFSHTPLVISAVMGNGDIVETVLPLAASMSLQKFASGGYCICRARRWRPSRFSRTPSCFTAGRRAL